MRRPNCEVSLLLIDHGQITRVRVAFDVARLLAAGDPRTMTTEIMNTERQ